MWSLKAVVLEGSGPGLRVGQEDRNPTDPLRVLRGVSVQRCGVCLRQGWTCEGVSLGCGRAVSDPPARPLLCISAGPDGGGAGSQRRPL